METEEPLPGLVVVYQDITFNPVTGTIILNILVICLLLGISSFLSASRAAYFWMKQDDQQRPGQNGSGKWYSVFSNTGKPEKLAATIVIVTNFVNVALIIFFVYVINSLIDFSQAPVVGFIAQVVFVALVIIIFGELLPGKYANPARVARVMTGQLRIMGIIFSPVIRLVEWLVAFLSKRSHNGSVSVPAAGLPHALGSSGIDGQYDDKEILEGIIRFGDKSTVDIMRARVDVVALDIKDTFLRVMQQIKESGYSRIPVYADRTDNIQGILYTKDILPHIHEPETFVWQPLIRPPFFVPETKKIDDLLEEFQKYKVHMAVVVDEYGGSSGIVTLEDVVEEIVGDIHDEFDEDDNYYTKIRENEYLFDGKIQLNDFYKVMGTEESIFDDVKGDADTLAGLMLELKKDIPAPLEQIACKNFMFTIEAIDNRRITKINCRLLS